MQIPTSPPLVGHNPRRNIALSLNWDPPIETGFPLRSELTNLQIGRVHFRREDLCPFLSSDYIQTSIWVPGLCRACRIPRNVKKKNISWDEFEMQCKLDLLWTATLWICSSQRERGRSRYYQLELSSISIWQDEYWEGVNNKNWFYLDFVLTCVLDFFLLALCANWPCLSQITSKGKSQAWAGVSVNQD